MKVNWRIMLGAVVESRKPVLVHNVPVVIRKATFWVVSRRASCDDGARP